MIDIQARSRLHVAQNIAKSVGHTWKPNRSLQIALILIRLSTVTECIANPFKTWGKMQINATHGKLYFGIIIDYEINA